MAERLIDGELVLYDPLYQRVHVLNATAAVAWQLFDGEHTPADIVAVLVERYPENRHDIEADVSRIMALFRSENLLEP